VREYELAVVMSVDPNETDENESFERVRQIVSARGGEITNEDVWGRRRLAYPIGKNLEGNYLISSLNLAPEGVKDLERALLLDERVLRHILIRRGD
jgi:small subunit ribosomal protein S6